MKKTIKLLLIGIPLLFLMPQILFAQRQMEKLDRGVIAVASNGGALVSWRIFGDDSAEMGYNLYQSINGSDAQLVNSEPIIGKSNYLIASVNISDANEYFIRPVVDGVEGEASKSFVLTSSDVYLSVPINKPTDGVLPDGTTYDYSANDCSVGDLNGDGQYEIIVKWMPSNAADNMPSFTGNTILDAYTMEGEKLWSIELGNNIRSGPHYTQFMVYDLDGDGKAEVACKTAPGTKDGTGAYLSKGPAVGADHTKDYRNSGGMILSGPEYLTIFNGWTGEEMVTTYYVPRRHPDTEDPTGDQLNEIWGDSYGNRVDRFLACIAYLDGVRPSLVMCRGYYTRTVVAAFDFRGGELSQRWVFDTMDEGNEAYAGQGNHNLSVADVDGDGKDEIIYGSMTVDDNGIGLYSTGLRHGDALHVSDLDPNHPGMEIFQVHEDAGNGVTFRDLATGDILWQHKKAGWDIGRGVAFDIDPNYPGAECWSSDGSGVYSSATGEVITTTYPQSSKGSISYNAGIWWDGDLLRELYDRTIISKWNWETKSTDRVLTVYNYGISDNNSTKSNPCLIADIWGDWREELICRASDNSALRIFTTRSETDYGFYTLMHDPQYRLSIAWQNVGYNQPAHTSFFLGDGMATPPTPSAIYVDAENPMPVDNTIPVLGAIEDQEVLLNESCAASLPDYRSLAVATDENYTTFTAFQSPEAGTAMSGSSSVEVSVYVNDGNGNNSNVVTFNAIPVDKISPVITKAIGDHSLSTTSGCGLSIRDYTALTEATDNCSSTLTVTQTPAAGTIVSGNGTTVAVTVSVADEAGNVTDSTFTVTVNAPECYATATNQELAMDGELTIYPNPATDYIYVDAGAWDPSCLLEIRTVDGVLVKSINHIEGNSTVSVSDLTTGIYIICLKGEKGSRFVKLIKN